MEHNHPLNKPVATLMVVFHLGAAAALFFPSLYRLALAFAVWYPVSLMTAVCYHRMLTHKGFKTYLWLEHLMALIGQLALQGLAAWWAAVHLWHHINTDVPGEDPHTPLDGKKWAHIDWLIHPDPELKKKVVLLKLVPKMMADPFYRKRYLEWAPTVTLATLCFLVGSGGFSALCLLWIGGIPLMLWGGAFPTWHQVSLALGHGTLDVLWGVVVPVVVGWHCTWLVNSYTHIWGRRRYETDDESRNSWLVAFFVRGEGHHNNHHMFPGLARHGHVWWEIDDSWYFIWFMGKLRLFWDIRSEIPEV